MLLLRWQHLLLRDGHRHLHRWLYRHWLLRMLHWHRRSRLLCRHVLHGQGSLWLLRLLLWPRLCLPRKVPRQQRRHTRGIRHLLLRRGRRQGSHGPRLQLLLWLWQGLHGLGHRLWLRLKYSTHGRLVLVLMQMLMWMLQYTCTQGRLTPCTCTCTCTNSICTSCCLRLCGFNEIGERLQARHRLAMPQGLKLRFERTPQCRQLLDLPH